MVRAVLMGATALLIRESDQRSRCGGVATHIDSDVAVSSRLGSLHWLSAQCCRHGWSHPVGPRLRETSLAEQSIADALAGFRDRGVLRGLGLDPAAATAAFRIHTALCARGQSAGCALIGSPHLVGDGLSGDGLGLAAPTVGGVGVARAAAGGTFDRFGALD